MNISDSRRVPDHVFGRDLDALVRWGVLSSWRQLVRRTNRQRRWVLTFRDGQTCEGGPEKVYGVILGATYARNGR